MVDHHAGIISVNIEEVSAWLALELEKTILEFGFVGKGPRFLLIFEIIDTIVGTNWDETSFFL